MLHRLLCCVFFLGVTHSASAQPKVCGNQTALGAWTLENCAILKDDGMPPDEVSGDGIYTVAVQLAKAALLEYKILPTGVWTGMFEIQQVGTCAYNGEETANGTQNIQVPSPNVAGPTRFFFDSRALSDSSYAPAPGNRSGGDSIMFDAPSGSCPTWIAVGDFQNLYGNNATAVRLLPQRPGLLVGHLTAAKALPIGWQWKLMQQTAGVVREYGPSGWAYSPCRAEFAQVSAAVMPGDSVYFLVHVHSGRLQTLVFSTPVDGYTADGFDVCAPSDFAMAQADMRTSPVLPPPDLSALDGTGSADPADGGMPRRRPGIHCDCQLGPTKADAATSFGLGLLLLLTAFIRTRLRSHGSAEG